MSKSERVELESLVRDCLRLTEQSAVHPSGERMRQRVLALLWAAHDEIGLLERAAEPAELRP